MSEKYQDQTLAPFERAKDLLNKMSVEEKMAQLNCAFLQPNNLDAIKMQSKHGVGQVSTLEVRLMESLDEVAAYLKSVQEVIMAQSEHHIPAVFHMEGLCGAFIQGATSFPSGIGRGSSWNPQLEERIAAIVSRQERAVGITQVFAPVLDISRDSRMGRQCESYGEDPTLAAAMGAAYTKGIQQGDENGRKAESVAKHFLGFHHSQGGIHGAACDIPTRLLEEGYAKPFQAAISESQLRGIMPSYSTVNGEPISASGRILTDLLRGKMGFDGVTVSDYSAVANVHSVQKMADSKVAAGLRCMEAGMDQELPNKDCYNDELTQWFKGGKADIEVLDQAVLRVLTAKFRMGLFEHPFALQGDALYREFCDEADAAITMQSALESLILLKNNGVLPIGKKIRKIAVIGCHAKNPRSFFGGYTHISMVEAVHAVANSIAGVGTSGTMDCKEVPTIPGTQIQSDETEEFDNIIKRIKPNCKSLLQELQDEWAGVEITYSYGYPIAGNDTSHFADALETVRQAELVILTLGGKNGSCSVASMGEGVDGTNINLPYCQDEFILQAARLGKPMVGIHFDGRPISSDIADEHLDAILEAWNPSEMGASAIRQVLSGEQSPSGKLPVSVAYNAGQIPIYYNHQNGSAYHQGDSIGFKNYVDMPHTPRYFFGHGLSYTRFEYSRLVLSKVQTEPMSPIEISVDIKNAGGADGTEIVQLYLRDRYASMVRPVMELAGFARVELLAGEQKTVTFTVHPSLTAFLDVQHKWKVEAGDVDVLIGASSEDIRLEGSFHITEDQYIEGENRAFYAAVAIKNEREGA